VNLVIGTRAKFTRRLLSWYDSNRRDLPWRTSPQRPGPLDPYHVLASETMLQQTQVATVIPYFERFIARFPRLADLAAAPQQEVLRLWQGLGYYSRARNLHAAAQTIVSEHHGQVPSELTELLALPGVGRYTAGAIASIAFDRPAPILDGNVIRVLCRIDAIEDDPREKRTLANLWRRAEELVPQVRPGDFNSGLMELGATVCTPANPKCLVCPAKDFCQAAAMGIQDRIPAARRRKPTPLVRRYVYCISRRGRWLLEQRPQSGRWAGMWQFITLEAPDPERLPVPIRGPRSIGRISHRLTHRRYEFDVFQTDALSGRTSKDDRERKWTRLAELDNYPLSCPHLQIAELLKSG
jgi:A/G-specific adenine glycosylase